MPGPRNSAGVEQEISQIRESPDAERESRVHHVVLIALDETPNFNEMPAARVHHAMFDAKNILCELDANGCLRTEARNPPISMLPSDSRPGMNGASVCVVLDSTS